MEDRGSQPVGDPKGSRSAATNGLLYRSLACFVGVSALVVLGIYVPAPWPVRIALLILASVLLIRGGVEADAYRRALEASKPRLTE